MLLGVERETNIKTLQSSSSKQLSFHAHFHASLKKKPVSVSNGGNKQNIQILYDRSLFAKIGVHLRKRRIYIISPSGHQDWN